MNYIKHLSGFFDKVSKDDRLNPTHVSLYVSLFQFWNACRFSNPISISRNEAMKVSKINSKATYHKCMRELNDFGYLSYQPSYNPFKGSLVYLFNFQPAVNKVNKQPKIETSPELALNGYHTKNETSTELALNKHRTSSEQALVSYINNTNIINNTNSINKTKQQTRVNAKKENTLSKINNDLKFISNEKLKKKKSVQKENGAKQKKEKSSAKKEKVSITFDEGRKYRIEPDFATEGFKRPLLPEIKTYFEENRWSAVEAQKFYNHYQSIGWLVGRKIPMVDWQASAHKWILNSNKFEENKSASTKLSKNSVDKNYNEPL
ncbi:transcriptional regulator [Aurantibacillus circumpalustris]|uniref:transcriptional regulator n=1 Tax=Aurantibacillus circumpalustris TaxID=3036359 RepID=UPI00295B82B2|nr:transcriptional regulator [Aurantibacillus circumpalustris]